MREKSCAFSTLKLALDVAFHIKCSFSVLINVRCFNKVNSSCLYTHTYVYRRTYITLALQLKNKGYGE